MNHFNPKIELSGYVYYKLLEENEKPRKNQFGSNIYQWEENEYACFSGITYQSLPVDVKSILVYHPVIKVPYTEFSIKRYLRHLNEIGFPNHYKGIKDKNYQVLIKLEDFNWKAHLGATLMLVRILWEKNLAIIPDIYLQILDKNPKADKFAALQDAHKQLTFGNLNHVVTFKSNGKNITFKTLMERFEASKVEVYGGAVNQSMYWRG